jgi:hypothetical protein
MVTGRLPKAQSHGVNSKEEGRAVRSEAESRRKV